MFNCILPKFVKIFNENRGNVTKWEFRIVNSFSPIGRVYARGVLTPDKWYIRHVYITAEDSQANALTGGSRWQFTASIVCFYHLPQQQTQVYLIRPDLSLANRPVYNIILDIAESDRFVNWWVPDLYKLNSKKQRILFIFISGPILRIWISNCIYKVNE